MGISSEAHLILNTPHIDELKSKIQSYREAEKTQNSWLKERLETVLPTVMKRCQVDMWIVACKEYNEDPVLASLTPVAMMTARRTTVLMFHLQADGTVRKMALTRPGVGLDDFYEGVWTNPKNSNWKGSAKLVPTKNEAGTKQQEPETQMECLARIVRECHPLVIGLNTSDVFAFGDGLTHTLYMQIMEALDKEDATRVVSAEKVCLGWLETRTPREIAAYTGTMQIAHALIAEAFSSRVIQPGVTTNDDVKYFMLQKTLKLGLTPWFDYEVSIRRQGSKEIYKEAIIMPGDILHCDVGIKYLGLCTDTQENAYVLKQDEVEAPAYLQTVMHCVNRLQDITIAHYAQGRSGNEVLALAREQAIKEGITPSIYTHPIGYHGHGAGPTIGLWDMQQGVPVMGDYLLYDHTCYSLELNCQCTVKEWDNQVLTFGAETDVLFENNHVYYLGGRQSAFHLIK